MEHYERDYADLQDAGTEPIYASLFGLSSNLLVDGKPENDQSSQEDSSGEEDAEKCETQGEVMKKCAHSHRPKQETPEEKRVNHFPEIYTGYTLSDY